MILTKRYWILLALFMGMIGCNTADPQPTEIPPTIDETGGETAEVIIEPTDLPATEMPTEEPIIPPTDIPTEIVEPTDVPTEIPPTEIPPTEPPAPTAEPIIEVAGAIVPDGFSLIKFAEVERPTNLAFNEEGTLFVTTQDGAVFTFRDTNGDGRSDTQTTFFTGFDTPVGIAQHPETGEYYVSSTGKISVLTDTDGDGVSDEARNLVNGLPNALHKNNNLEFGPDGMLYMGIGSTCNSCIEEDERSATIMKFDPATGDGEIVATGLRNPYDIAFHPENGDLFATENGRDDLGDFAPQEELNHIRQNKDYGWPKCYDVAEGGESCISTERAIGYFDARSSVNGLDFYTGDQYPEEYQGKLFAGVFGSWVRDDIGRGIWMIDLENNGPTYSTNIEWFVEWPDGWLLGLVEGADGIYVTDYINGGIYKITATN